MIPRVAYVLILTALAGALVAASAAEGTLDHLPPQPCFPAALGTPQTAPCDPRGARYPESYSISDRGMPVVSDFEAEWFGRQLRAAHEVSLSQPRAADPPLQTIRFTWLRSFHAPVIVRVDESADGRLQLTAKRLTGHGGYAPGRIGEKQVRILNREEAAALRRTLERANVFELPPLGCSGGADGAEWLLEARDARRYHLALRWSPEGGPVHDVGLLLLGFTRWKLDPIY